LKKIYIVIVRHAKKIGSKYLKHLLKTLNFQPIGSVLENKIGLVAFLKKYFWISPLKKNGLDPIVPTPPRNEFLFMKLGSVIGSQGGFSKIRVSQFRK
jgi:hypothetical protein